MTQTPERIWAWYFVPEKQDDVIKGGWDDVHDRKSDEYVRADLHAALEVENARLREGLEEIDMRGKQYAADELADMARAVLDGKDPETVFADLSDGEA